MKKLLKTFNSKITILIFTIFTIYGYSSAEHAFFFNPGIKIGYNFGKYHGFVIGTESSFGMSFWKEPRDNWTFAGIVVGYSYCFRKDFNRNIYLEFEGGNVGFGGGSLGVLFNTEKSVINPYLRIFIGGIGYLSLRYPIGELPTELSLIGKLPLTTKTPVLD